MIDFQVELADGYADHPEVDDMHGVQADSVVAELATQLEQSEAKIAKLRKVVIMQNDLIQKLKLGNQQKDKRIIELEDEVDSLGYEIQEANGRDV